MAQTIKEISDSMKAAYVHSSAVRSIYNLESQYIDENIAGDDAAAVVFFNKYIGVISVTAVIISCIATVAALLQNLFSYHKEDVEKIVDNERYGHKGWYENMALKFQYSSALNVNYTEIPDPNAIDGDFSEEDVYTPIDATLQIVKYAYAEEQPTGFGVLLKIAKEASGQLMPLGDGNNGTDNEITPFTSYMNRIKPAGVPLTIRNTVPDRLFLNLRIYYDPLIVNSSGELLSDTSIKPVETAIQSYLNSLNFNGEFINMKLIDAVQQAQGVVVAELMSSQAQYAGNNAQNIEDRYTPYSGYMQLDFTNDLIVDYRNNY